MNIRPIGNNEFWTGCTEYAVEIPGDNIRVSSLHLGEAHLKSGDILTFALD